MLLFNYGSKCLIDIALILLKHSALSIQTFSVIFKETRKKRQWNRSKTKIGPGVIRLCLALLVDVLCDYGCCAQISNLPLRVLLCLFLCSFAVSRVASKLFKLTFEIKCCEC